jgi:hypothetical protein
LFRPLKRFQNWIFKKNYNPIYIFYIDKVDYSRIR